MIQSFGADSKILSFWNVRLVLHAHVRALHRLVPHLTSGRQKWSSKSTQLWQSTTRPFQTGCLVPPSRAECSCASSPAFSMTSAAAWPLTCRRTSMGRSFWKEFNPLPTVHSYDGTGPASILVPKRVDPLPLFSLEDIATPNCQDSPILASHAAQTGIAETVYWVHFSW